jgi:UDP-3-O-[3-hydroxymyristoyl] glucosamine N-acyltransferase
VIKDRVLIDGNVTIGSYSFEFGLKRKNIKEIIPHSGSVYIDSDVLIGAGTTIQCSKMRDTYVGKHTKIGNQVLITHGIQIGDECRIAGHASIGGETIIGDGAFIGGGCSISNNLVIGENAGVVGHSCVINDVKSDETVMGIPAINKFKFFKQFALNLKLEKICDNIKNTNEKNCIGNS